MDDVLVGGLGLLFDLEGKGERFLFGLLLGNKTVELLAEGLVTGLWFLEELFERGLLFGNEGGEGSEELGFLWVERGLFEGWVGVELLLVGKFLFIEYLIFFPALFQLTPPLLLRLFHFLLFPRQSYHWYWYLH